MIHFPRDSSTAGPADPHSHLPGCHKSRSLARLASLWRDGMQYVQPSPLRGRRMFLVLLYPERSRPVTATLQSCSKPAEWECGERSVSGSFNTEVCEGTTDLCGTCMLKHPLCCFCSGFVLEMRLFHCSSIGRLFYLRGFIINSWVLPSCSEQTALRAELTYGTQCDPWWFTAPNVCD